MWFLTTTCLAGGFGDTPAAALPAAAPVVSSAPAGCGACCQTACCEKTGPFRGLLNRLRHDDCCTSSCGSCCADACGGHRFRLFERLRGLFRRGNCCESCCQKPCCSPAPALAPAPAPVQKVIADRTASDPTQIDRDYLDKVGNAADYSWVTGQLYYIHADGGLWVVRYAPVDREDRYGGSVVLAPAVTMQGYQEGDLVTVRGEILNEGRASKYLGGPLYRATGVNLQQRKEKVASSQ